MILQWFLSPAVRQATAMRKHVQKLLNHQRDILAPPAIEAMEAAMAGCATAVAGSAANTRTQFNRWSHRFMP